MGKTLLDQLKKTGLVDSKKARQIKKEQHTKKKKKKGKGGNQTSAIQKEALKYQADKKAKDKALNQKKREEEQKRSHQAQLKQLIENKRISEKDGDIRFHFSDGSKVERLHVTEKTQEQLTGGQLGIVKWQNQYHIIPKDVAQKIQQQEPAALLFLSDGEKTSKTNDDPYAQYTVPDDLMW